MTPANKPPLAQDPDAKLHPFMFRLDLLQNDRVRYANQPIAVVIAKTLEAATEGAALLAPRYETEPARVGLDSDRELRSASGGRRQSGRGAARRRRGGPRGGVQAHRRDLRDAAAISQRDGAARDRRGMGRRHAVDRYAEPGSRHGAGTRRRTVRHSAGEHPYPQPLPGRRLRFEGLHLRASGARHHGGPAGRQAGQAGAASRADVRPGRPSRADPADAAHGHRPRWRADGDRPSHEDGIQHVRRLLRAGLGHLAHAVCQPRHRHVA